MKRTILPFFASLILCCGCATKQNNTETTAEAQPVQEEQGITASRSLRGWYNVLVQTTLRESDLAVQKVASDWKVYRKKVKFDGYSYDYEFTDGNRVSYCVKLKSRKDGVIQIYTFVSENGIYGDNELSANLMSDILVALGVDLTAAQGQ